MSDTPLPKPTPDDTMGRDQPDPPATKPVDGGAQEDAAKDREDGRGYD